MLVINSPTDKGEGPRDERLRLSGPLRPKMANEQGIHEPLQSMIYDAHDARFIAEPKFLHKPSRQGGTKVPSSTGSRRSHVAAFTSIGTRSGPVGGFRWSWMRRRTYGSCPFDGPSLGDSASAPQRRSSKHFTACSRKQALLIKCETNHESMLCKDLQITSVIVVAPNRYSATCASTFELTFSRVPYIPTGLRELCLDFMCFSQSVYYIYKYFFLSNFSIQSLSSRPFLSLSVCVCTPSGYVCA